jgi:hypothetical protein
MNVSAYVNRLQNEPDLDIKLAHEDKDFIFIRREDSHFNEAKRSKWEMNRLNYIY